MPPEETAAYPDTDDEAQEGETSPEEKAQEAYLDRFDEPDHVIRGAYDDMIGASMDSVASVYENRKQKSLKMMLKTFNKLQGIEFKRFGKDL